VPGPFRYLFRVRYAECDPQRIVFNSRWGDYVDLAATEYTRRLFGSVDPDADGLDYRLVRQLLEWRSPARFDDVLSAEVDTARVGTTSFTLATRFRRLGEEAVLVTAETVYVVVAPHSGTKQQVPDRHRAALLAGAPDVVIDHAGTGKATG
jgi:acyl-CoA thioester hydrolase